MSTNLIRLYNEDVDFVKQIGDFDYVPVGWPKHATHHLKATRWNKRDEFKPNSRGKVVQPEGYALSVVAEPMHFTYKRTAMVVRAVYPKHGVPAYRQGAGVAGKRNVLRFLLEAMRPLDLPQWRRKLKRLDELECDGLYTNLIRASRKFTAVRAARREAIKKKGAAYRALNFLPPPIHESKLS